MSSALLPSRHTDTVRVLTLDDPTAQDVARVGAKAATLARARAAGLPVLPGVAVTVPGHLDDAATHALRHQLTALRAEGDLIVRSSATIEDGAQHSMAGLFRSVGGVTPDRLPAAVAAVVASGPPGTMGVLVQPELAPVLSGVLFTVDPVTGDPRHLTVAVTTGPPAELVGGSTDGHMLTLTPAGRRIAGPHEVDGVAVPTWRLARLGRRAEALLDGPADVEWAMTGDGTVWLLQVRPVTTHRSPTGPVLGTGPAAETFPAPLRRLEADLWVPPLRDGLRWALTMAGTATARQLETSALVTVVDGHVAVDLELLGEVDRRTRLARLDPRPGARRLGASWNLGRVRTALPALAERVRADSDRHLQAVPPTTGLSTDALVTVLENSRELLSVLHRWELLAGILLPPDATVASMASVALDQLVAGRANGLDDDTIAARLPATLLLAPPGIGARHRLPELPQRRIPTPGTAPHPIAVAREALRLRIRWVHELTARTASEVGRRLHADGHLPTAATVSDHHLDDLTSHVRWATPLPDVAPTPADAPAPPHRFRLATDGHPVPWTDGAAGGARGAGGGRTRGRIHHHRPGTVPPADAVLAVPALVPELAPVLTDVRAVVSATGNPLSHLAILAREADVPTVVGQDLTNLPDGAHVLVDGDAGTVTRLDTPTEA